MDLINTSDAEMRDAAMQQLEGMSKNELENMLKSIKSNSVSDVEFIKQQLLLGEQISGNSYQKLKDAKAGFFKEHPVVEEEVIRVKVDPVSKTVIEEPITEYRLATPIASEFFYSEISDRDMLAFSSTELSDEDSQTLLDAADAVKDIGTLNHFMAVQETVIQKYGLNKQLFNIRSLTAADEYAQAFVRKEKANAGRKFKALKVSLIMCRLGELAAEKTASKRKDYMIGTLSPAGLEAFGIDPTAIEAWELEA